MEFEDGWDRLGRDVDHVGVVNISECFEVIMFSIVDFPAPRGPHITRDFEEEWEDRGWEAEGQRERKWVDAKA